MAGFQIKVRNLETDETLIATLDKYEDALVWLSERPHLMEVLTVISDVSPKQMRELKEAMRPYDEEEQKAIQSRAKELVDAVRKVRENEEARAAAEEARAKMDAKNADPNRPMKVRWSIDGGCVVNDAFDDRGITAAASAAVLAWVKERNGWVAERGQIVAEAELEVYPNDVPSGDESKRVLGGGRFTPRLRDGEA
jgi:hypothetical protein